MHLYSVFDSLAERWHVPYCMESDAIAQRTFISSVADSPMAQSPGDFALFKVGDFDPDTGLVHGDNTPSRLMSALEALTYLKAAQAADDDRQLKLAGGGER